MNDIAKISDSIGRVRTSRFPAFWPSSPPKRLVADCGTLPHHLRRSVRVICGKLGGVLHHVLESAGLNTAKIVGSPIQSSKMTFLADALT